MIDADQLVGMEVSMDKNIGKKLEGRYEITELIGVGGMADVYKATDVVDKKTVAVKILKKEFAENEEFLRRFRNESKAIAVLSHPNIVKIYDVGFSEKIQFIVMEYIDGITLKEYMETEQVLSWKDAVHFITQILRALQHAHGRGIVHRDIKPQNIMLFPDGTIKVMDFGIAKFAREQGKTATDQAIGTVHYISPEQARGDVTDEKSDVYSVGVMFYEMLTGKKPFDTDNPVTIAVMHMQTTPERPRNVNPDVPAGLEEIILHAMQKDPADRYASAVEMMKDIDRFKEDPGVVFGYEDGLAPAVEEDSPTRFFKPVVPAPAAVPAPVEPVEEPAEEYDDDYEYEDEEEEEIEERRSLFVPILTGVIITVIVVAVFLITTLVVDFLKNDNKGNDKEFAMDSLIGMDFNEAKMQYHDTGKLELVVIASEYSDYKKDQIFYQSVPEGDPVAKGERVEIKVSLGANTIPIPDVTNLNQNYAEEILTAKGFKVTTRQTINDEVAKGCAIKTEPPAGTEIAPNASVTLYISKGPNTETFEMPNFVGKSIELAKIDAMLYEFEIIEVEVDSAQDKGTVVEQSVGAGTQVTKGMQITLSVSNGVAPESTALISFVLPEDVTGTFNFSFYDGGVLFATSKTINAAYATGTTAIELSGTGKKELVAVVTNLANNKSATVGTYAVDFDAQTHTALAGVNVAAAFDEVGLTQKQTTTAATTTTTGATTTTAVNTTTTTTTTTVPEETTTAPSEGGDTPAETTLAEANEAA
ncbi:MAG: Stk1 family PASTA domain-containing Ser/Thr kinase [Ruminococcus sp.]|nr:Stk1 family PASTA domain-containing Ser/Thr kinase [Ruminococcus sp.]